LRDCRVSGNSGFQSLIFLGHTSGNDDSNPRHNGSILFCF